MWGELATSFQHGNSYLYLMMGIAFFATMIVIERFMMLQFVYNIDFSKFLTNFKKMIAAEDLGRAMNLCKSVRNTSLPRISLRALEAAETDPTTIRGTIEEETIDFLPRLEARLGILPAFGTLIMLIGILGTIDALWGAFHSIDVLDTAKKQASLANGIAASLNPAAMGLLVCMLIIGCHQVLRGMALKVTDRVHHGVAVLRLLVPQEMPTFMPMAAPMEAVASDSNFDAGGDFVADGNQTQETAEEAADDAFDDASVDDIKDEEEII